MIIMPNEFNKSESGYFCTFFCHTIFKDLAKNANSNRWYGFGSVLFKFVWRQSEFAFFMRQLLLNEYKEDLRNGDTMGFLLFVSPHCLLNKNI